MTKSQLLSELERLKGDPEIILRAKDIVKLACPVCRTRMASVNEFTIDRINEFPSPEIIIVEK